MNDEAGPSGTQRGSFDNEASERDGLLDPDTSNNDDDATERRDDAAWKRRGKEKRISYLHNLLSEFDMIIVAQLAIIYCLDCSFIRFLFRAAIQVAYLMPKPSHMPEIPSPVPYLGGLFGSNVICMICHLVFARPEAGETTRGYLHGGAMIDFIGTEGPISKTRLLLLDVLVLTLQLNMLSAHVLHKRLKSNLLTGPTTDTAQDAVEGVEPTLNSDQDLDAEERGVIRDADEDEMPVDSLRDGIDGLDHSLDDDDDDGDSSPAGMDETSDQSARVTDALNSGQIVIANISVFSTIREQYTVYRYHRPSADDSSSSSTARSAALSTADLVGRRVGLRSFLRRARSPGG